jgi:hypothetical protein
MSMRFKLALTVLIALLVNIAGLILCYNLFISTRVSNHLGESQKALSQRYSKSYF